MRIWNQNIADMEDKQMQRLGVEANQAHLTSLSEKLQETLVLSDIYVCAVGEEYVTAP